MNLSTTWRRRLYWLTWGLLIIISLTAAVALWQWYDSGGGFEAIYVAVGILLAGLWTANRFLARQSITQQTDQQTYQSLPPTPQSLSLWRQQMNTLFTLEELRSLTFDLGFAYDNLAGETLAGKIVSLLEYVQKHNQLPQLHAKLKQARPHVIWLNPGLQSPVHDDRNRANFLNLVQSSWIDGFLHQSLHREVLKLTLSYQPDAVPQPAWGMVLQQAGQNDQAVPPGQSIREIFERHGRSLLLLGDPGSGKTITMLQLAEELVKLAQNDPAQPMPVVLNLSSWAQAQPPLIEWLTEEIFVQYGVARELGRRWIAQNQLVYLLDGLDEVAAEARDECITAINDFKAAYPAEMLVCSRVKDYEALRNRLHLGAAIRIQPLTDTEVDHFLRQPGLEMQAVCAMLKTDPTLRELTHSPLLLNVMALAYRGKNSADLKSLTTVEARRHHLFDTYVDTMFQRRPLPIGCPYSEADAHHWLACLASGMSDHEQSIFYVERLQPTWLPTQKLRRRYDLTVGRITGLIFGLIFGFIFGLPGGLIFGLIFGLIGGLTSEHSEFEKPIKLVEELTWRPPQNLWPQIKEALAAMLLAGLIFGLLFGLVGGLLVGLNFGLLGGLIILLFSGLSEMLNFDIQESRYRLKPNQGIYISRRNLWRISLLYSILFGGMVAVLVFFIDWLNISIYREYLARGLAFFAGMGILILGFWRYGGETIIEHYTLRWLLARQNTLPYPFRDKRLVAFLDDMVDRIFLRRAGGGYLFIHRALLEHFAALSSNSCPEG